MSLLAALAVLSIPFVIVFALWLHARRLQRACDELNARHVDENGEWDPRKWTIWGY